jgi:hypothetical protein
VDPDREGWRPAESRELWPRCATGTNRRGLEECHADDADDPAHPIYIHINPFQVTEILNPAVSKTPVKLPAPLVWWDSIAISTGGYIKFLSHISGHEDRGMIQMVEVIGDMTTMRHH